ncbi:hypothetical protein Tco_0018290 [Tanacetum coccineum]
MSSATSAVTYTSVYTDSEPGRAFWGADDEEISEGGIPRVIVLGYDGLPMQPVAPPSPDYIPGPEDPQTPPVPQDEDEREPMFVQAHDPDYVPEPIYPEYIPLEDEHEFPAEEQPLPPVDSPTAESPGYVTESDPEEDPEEYEDDETEDGPVDYPMDGGDDGDDDDGDSSRDDANDEDEDEDEDDEDEEEEEEEHLAPTDSAIVVPVDEPVFPSEGTEPVIPPPSTDITIGARIITLRIASTQALIDVVTTALPSLPPSLYIPPPVEHRDRFPESGDRLWVCQHGRLAEIDERRLEMLELLSSMSIIHTLVMIYLEDAQDSRYCGMVEGGGYASKLGSLDSSEAELATLRETDRRRQDQIRTLRVIKNMRREMIDMQAELYVSLRNMPAEESIDSQDQG